MPGSRPRLAAYPFSVSSWVGTTGECTDGFRGEVGHCADCTECRFVRAVAGEAKVGDLYPGISPRSANENIFGFEVCVAVRQSVIKSEIGRVYRGEIR